MVSRNLKEKLFDFFQIPSSYSPSLWLYKIVYQTQRFGSPFTLPAKQNKN